MVSRHCHPLSLWKRSISSHFESEWGRKALSVGKRWDVLNLGEVRLGVPAKEISYWNETTNGANFFPCWLLITICLHFNVYLGESCQCDRRLGFPVDKDPDKSNFSFWQDIASFAISPQKWPFFRSNLRYLRTKDTISHFPPRMQHKEFLLFALSASPAKWSFVLWSNTPKAQKGHFGKMLSTLWSPINSEIHCNFCASLDDKTGLTITWQAVTVHYPRNKRANHYLFAPDWLRDYIC